MATFAKYDVVSDAGINLSATGNSVHNFPLETPGINVGVRTLVTYLLNPDRATWSTDCP